MTSAIVLRTQSDERLSALAAEGSERAFEVIVSRYRRDLVAYCSRVLRSDSRGEDAVQQALLNAWIALRDGTGVRELKPWLFRIAYNQAISARRRSGHDYEQLSEIADGSDHELDRRMELRETLAAVAALPDLQRRRRRAAVRASHVFAGIASVGQQAPLRSGPGHRPPGPRPRLRRRPRLRSRPRPPWQLTPPPAASRSGTRGCRSAGTSLCRSPRRRRAPAH